MKMNLAYIASVVGGKLSPSTNPERVVNGFFSDSRTPFEDKLFLALVGERVDGNAYVPELLKKGFCAILDNAEYMPEYGSCILVDNVRESLQKLACHYRTNELKSIPVVGITGSVGKTTTKDMVALALSSCKKVHKTEGNSNSQIGLPQTVLATSVDVDCAIFELGMSMKGEMERISRCAIPDISIVTNIGYSHLENLGTREAIRDEKLKLAGFSKKDSVLLLNGDEPLLRDIENSDKKVYYISVDNTFEKNDCFAKEIIETEAGVEFTASIFGEEYNVLIPAKGKHFVMNSLFALATAKLLGCDIEKCIKALSEYVSDGRRQFVYEKDGHTVISDCYNAAPDSMKASLSVLATYKKGRRIAVLGDMLELGKDTVALHKEIGKTVSESADVLVTYGTLAANIAEAAKIESYVFKIDEKEKLKEFLKDYIKNDDTVLYKASNGMKLSEVII